jgi:prevent-host-death family protein
MAAVTIRDLRHRGGDIVDRAERGERIVVTRDGRPVAELRPAPRAPLRAEVLIERRRHLPPMDPDALRRDLDAVLDPTL